MVIHTILIKKYKQTLAFLTGIFLTFGTLTAQEPKQVSETESKIQDAFLAARLHAVSGHTDKALKVLDSLSREHRQRAVIYYEMATLHFDQKNFEKAVEFLHKALSIEKNNFWFIEKMALAQAELSQINLAIEYFQQLINLRPKSARYYDITADLLLKSNRQMEALQLLMKKENQLGFAEYNTFKMIDIAMDIKRYDIATTEVEKLLNRNVPKLSHLKRAVSVYKMKGDGEKVAQLQEKIITMDPNDVDAMLDKLERDNGKLDETGYLISLQPLVQNRSVHPENKIKELLPFVEGHAKNPNVAYADALLNLAGLLANAHPEDARVHAMYGDVLMNSHREVEAVRQYERTLEISKNNFMVWEQLLYGLEYLGEFERLGEVAEAAIDYFPNQAISYYFAAVSLFEKSSLPRAKEFLQEAELISAKNPIIMSRVFLLRSRIAYRENKKDEAMILADKSIEVSQGLLGSAYEWKGDIYLDSGKKEEAKVLFLKAMEFMPRSKTLPTKIAACS